MVVKMKTIYYQTYSIQQHTYILAASQKGLVFVGSSDGNLSELIKFYPDALLLAKPLPDNYSKQLAEYLTGTRQSFDLSLDISGTAFQEQVWQALQQIPYGTTTDYSQIAKTIGKTKAVRAVGSAIGKNPVLMVIPCHRVLTKQHQLGGYRGGLAMKQALLDLERKRVAQ